MKYLVAFLVFFNLSLGNQAWAADESGKFAVKGAGRKSCSDFLEAHKSGSRDYLLFGGWLEGYISAYNQFQIRNYDITPWQTTELILAMAAHHCKSNPDTRLLNVTNGLIEAFAPIRLSSESKVVKLNIANRESYYYSEIIKQVKARLARMGYFKGSTSSDQYRDKEIAAMIKYQRDAGLPQTGVPDQKTLASLFLKLKN